MNKLEERVHLLNEQILLQEKNQDKLLFLNEMKKIGIEKLPYSYSSLKQFIDSETMSYHYNKHYKGYVDKLNKALSKKDYGDLELEEIIKSISKFNTTIRNNAGGAFNHALFWKMLSPKKQTPKGELLKKIKSEFGSFNEFKTQFEEVAKERFGSGWVWLVLTKKNQLKIMSTPNSLVGEVLSSTVIKELNKYGPSKNLPPEASPYMLTVVCSKENLYKAHC